MLAKLFSLSFLNAWLSIIGVFAAIYLLGVSSVKDEVDLFTATSKTLVAGFGIGALGGSTLYVIASKFDSGCSDRSEEIIFAVVFAIQCFFGFVLIISGWFISSSLLIDIDALAFLRNIKAEIVVFYILYIVIQPTIDLITGFLLGTKRFPVVLRIQIFQKFFNLLGLLAASFFGVFGFCCLFAAGILITCLWGFYSLDIRVRARDFLSYEKVSEEMTRLVKMSLPFIILGPAGGVGVLLLYPLVVQHSPGDLAAFTYAQAAVSICLAALAFPIAEPLIQRISGIWSGVRDNVEVSKDQIRTLVLVQGVRQLSFLLACTLAIALSVLIFGELVSELLGEKVSSVYASVENPLLLIVMSMPAQHAALVVNRIMISIDRPWMSAMIPTVSSLVAVAIVMIVFRLEPNIGALVTFSLLGSVIAACVSAIVFLYFIGVTRDSGSIGVIFSAVVALPLVGMLLVLG